MLHAEGVLVLESMTGGHAFLVKDSAAQRKKENRKETLLKLKCPMRMVAKIIFLSIAMKNLH